jgi:anti-sigma-K factor RskA
MSGAEDLDNMNPDDLLAMDVALGVLGREDRRAAEVRQRSDPAFRALVEAWTLRLSPLDEFTAPVAPPSSVWQGISDEIAVATARSTSVATARSAAVATARSAAVATARARPGLWHSLGLWRGLAFAGTAAAAIALTQIGQVPTSSGPPPHLLVAALAGADGKPLLSAAYDPLRGAVVLTPATHIDNGGKSPELWVIEGDKPPRSLGVIDISGPNAHAIASQRLVGLKPGATLAISIEPFGGSTTGLPTGPVVASGKLSPV